MLLMTHLAWEEGRAVFCLLVFNKHMHLFPPYTQAARKVRIPKTRNIPNEAADLHIHLGTRIHRRFDWVNIVAALLVYDNTCAVIPGGLPLEELQQGLLSKHYTEPSGCLR